MSRSLAATSLMSPDPSGVRRAGRASAAGRNQARLPASCCAVKERGPEFRPRVLVLSDALTYSGRRGTASNTTHDELMAPRT